MADDTLDDASAAPQSAKAKREGPTIDLEATEISAETKPADGPADPLAEPHADSTAEAAPEPEKPGESPAVSEAPAKKRPISAWVIAPFSGAVAAALVLLVGWMLGWPPVQAPPPASQANAASVDELASRVAGLETKAGKPVTDPAVGARLDGLDKSNAALRGELANVRAQMDKLAAAVNEIKSAPRDAAAPVDLSAINERIAQLERAVRATAQQQEKVAQAKPADDQALRRVVAAALLDVAVRHGDPYSGALKAAKALAADPDTLKPLDQFADSGVPSPQTLDRELLTLVPKLSPAAQEATTTGNGIIDRLQAGATKLVRIERTDTPGNDRNAIVARVTAAALRNDFGEARRELNSLPSAERAPAQGWLDKAAARDAALAASRQFAEDAMAALAKTAQ